MRTQQSESAFWGTHARQRAVSCERCITAAVEWLLLAGRPRTSVDLVTKDLERAAGWLADARCDAERAQQAADRAAQSAQTPADRRAVKKAQQAAANAAERVRWIAS